MIDTNISNNAITKDAIDKPINLVSLTRFLDLAYNIVVTKINRLTK